MRLETELLELRLAPSASSQPLSYTGTAASPHALGLELSGTDLLLIDNSNPSDVLLSQPLADTTGVDITGYGADLPGAPKLGTLVKQILKHVPELKRLRLSSIDSVEADRDLLDALAGDPRLMPHLHLSLQSGDDLILKRMKRRHSRADAIAFCRRVRQLRPDIVFGADLIAGFPTESDDMFRHSLDLVAECGLTYLHVFPFSPRPGTPAARMPQIDRNIVKERARRLRECGALALTRHLDGEVGAARRALVESRHAARTEQFTAVKLGAPAEPGNIVELRIVGHDRTQLLAA